MSLHPSLQPKEPISHNKFFMLRTLIAMAHADGIFCSEEEAYISGILGRLCLTDEQKQTFDEDFKTPQNFFDLLSNINDPSYRTDALYFMRILAHKDGSAANSEQDLLDKMQSLLRDNVDIEQIREDVKRAVEVELSIHDAEMHAIRPKGWMVFSLFDKLMLLLGIDLMEDDYKKR